MKTKKAFTLIELLVVISIIAVLMSIMMPALSRVREQAKRVACKTNIHQQGVAIACYASANNNKYPLAAFPSNWPMGGLINGVQEGWDTSNAKPILAGQAALYSEKYIEDSSCFFCPSALPSRSIWNEENKWYPYVDNLLEGAYCGYPFWAGYGYRSDRSFRSGLWWDEKKRNKFKKRTAKDPYSRSDTVCISDIIIGDTAVETLNWNNHISKQKPAGGNILYNDNSVSWQSYEDTESMLEIYQPYRTFFHF